MNSSIWTIEERNPSSVTGQPSSNAFIYNRDRTLPDNLSGFRLRDADRFTYPNPSFLYTGDALRGYFTAGTTTEQKDIWIDKQQEVYGMAGHLDLPTLRNVRTTDDGVPVQQVVRDPGAWAGPSYEGTENGTAYPDNTNRANSSAPYSGRDSLGGSMYGGSRTESRKSGGSSEAGLSKRMGSGRSEAGSSMLVDPESDDDDDDNDYLPGGFRFYVASDNDDEDVEDNDDLRHNEDGSEEMLNDRRDDDDDDDQDGDGMANMEEPVKIGVFYPEMLEEKLLEEDFLKVEKEKVEKIEKELMEKELTAKRKEDRRRKREEQMKRYDKNMEKWIKMIQDQSDRSVEMQVDQYKNAKQERDEMFGALKSMMEENKTSANPASMRELLGVLDNLKSAQVENTALRLSEKKALDGIANQIATGINVKLSEEDMKRITERNDTRIESIFEALGRIEETLNNKIVGSSGGGSSVGIESKEPESSVVSSKLDAPHSKLMWELRDELSALKSYVNALQKTSLSTDKRDELLKIFNDTTSKLSEQMNSLQTSMIGDKEMKSVRAELVSLRGWLSTLAASYGGLVTRSDLERFIQDREQYVKTANSNADTLFKSFLQELDRNDIRQTKRFNEMLKQFELYEQKISSIRSDIGSALTRLLSSKYLADKKDFENYLTEQYKLIGSYQREMDALRYSARMQEEAEARIAQKLKESSSPITNSAPFNIPKLEQPRGFNIPELEQPIRSYIPNPGNPNPGDPKPEEPKPESGYVPEREIIYTPAVRVPSTMDEKSDIISVLNPQANLNFWNDQDMTNMYSIGAKYQDAPINADFMSATEQLSVRTIDAISGLRDDFKMQKDKFINVLPNLSTFYNRANRMKDEDYKTNMVGLQNVANEFRRQWNVNAEIIIDNYVESNNALLYYFNGLQITSNRPIPITIKKEIFEHFDVLNHAMTNVLNMSVILNDVGGTRATGSGINIVKALAAFQFENERFILFARNLLAYNIQTRIKAGIPGAGDSEPSDPMVARDWRQLNRFFNSYIEKAKNLQEEYSIEYVEGLLQHAHKAPYSINYETFKRGMFRRVDEQATPTIGYSDELKKGALQTYKFDVQGGDPGFSEIKKTFYDNFNLNSHEIVQLSQRYHKSRTGDGNLKAWGKKPSELVNEWLQTMTENKAKRREVSVDLSSGDNSLVEYNGGLVIFEEDNSYGV